MWKNNLHRPTAFDGLGAADYPLTGRGSLIVCRWIDEFFVEKQRSSALLKAQSAIASLRRQGYVKGGHRFPPNILPLVPGSPSARQGGWNILGRIAAAAMYRGDDAGRLRQESSHPFTFVHRIARNFDDDAARRG